MSPVSGRVSRVLALIDIDGTLVRGTPVAHGLALCAALGDVYGVSVTHDDLLDSGPAGRTDREIAVRLLAARGVPGDAAAPLLDEWCARAVVRYREIADTHSHPRAFPDAPRALGRLVGAGMGIVLVTGNIEDIAHDKLARAGLGGLFPRGQGGFGGDAVDRGDLVRTALGRAGVPAAAGVVIGDTPHDVAAARAAGCGVVAVTTGRHTAEDVDHADRVAASLTEAAEAAVRLLAGAAEPV